MRRTTKESSLKRAAKDFLAYRQIKTWAIGASAFHSRGLPDRIGVFKGRPLAIEFKSPKGKLSPEQKEFREAWEGVGGIYIEARSIEDLVHALGIKGLTLI